MKKTIIFAVSLIMILTLAACGRQPQTQEPGNGVVDPNPQGEQVEVTLYYMNREYIVTGNESLERVIPVVKEVTIGEKPLEEVIMAELQKQPEEENLLTAMENIRVLSVETAGNTAYVNLSSERLAGGSLDEISILLQIILSLTELPDIDKVQIYVDGSVRETLMGHFEIMEPFTRGDLGY